MRRLLRPPFDLDAAWRLAPQVSLRPEKFGALLYDFDSRRLSFCKNTTIVGIVTSLAEHETARAACTAADVPDTELPTYERALAALAETGTIARREDE